MIDILPVGKGIDVEDTYILLCTFYIIWFKKQFHTYMYFFLRRQNDLKINWEQNL